MGEIDFEFIDENGWTIYRACFGRYANAISTSSNRRKISKLVRGVEENFFSMVTESKKKLSIEDVNNLIQKPSLSGDTCFLLATQCSPKIAKFILSQNIKINCITTDMVIPSFEYPELAEEMLIKNINPKVIGYDGRREFDIWPNTFQNQKCNNLALNFPRSIHFMTEATECNKNCGKDCKSKLKPFFYENGSLVDINDDNKLGIGGFGTVYSGKWHGENVAMKCVLIDQIEYQTYVHDTVDAFEKNISEYRSQSVAKGSGVIFPYAMVRQQNQEWKDGRWTALNFNVFIYPKYDCNLYELHKNHFTRFNNDILHSIIKKCFIRK